MKTLFTFLAALTLTIGVFAQSPEKMSYQAVIRDSNDELITNQEIGMQISILQGSVSGTAVYVETQGPTTNANGLVTLEIGTGTSKDDFSSIDWADGPYFIKTETDPTTAGGTNYTITGTSQLLSVPYALHAKTADSITNLNEIYSEEFYLGQDTLGGIVFYIYRDKRGQQHGLIVSKTETNSLWQSTPGITGAGTSWDGAYNTGRMSGSPVKSWIKSNFSAEWYLPSIDELGLLWRHRFLVNQALIDSGNAPMSKTASIQKLYLNFLKL